MPPINPPLKNDGPACRVCGCTEHNACLTEGHVFDDVPCSWVKTPRTEPPLCTACAGTAEDLAEAVGRAVEKPSPRRPASHKQMVLKTALARYRQRKKEVDAAS